MKKILTFAFSVIIVAGLVAFTTIRATSAQPKEMKNILPLPPVVFDSAGNEIKTESLRGKIVALYFSAHWCAPCKIFTPKLIDFHKSNKDQKFEVVFMSLDHSPSMKADYMKEEGMLWPTVPGQGTAEISQIMDFYKLPGVPALLVFGPDGQVITNDGRSDVENDPAEALAKWKAAL